MQLTGIILQLPGERFPQADPSRKRTATWRNLWPYGRSGASFFLDKSRSSYQPRSGKTNSSLNAEIATLKDELATLQRTAEGHRKDAATWRERYEKAKTSITAENLGDLQRRAAVEKVMKVMKEDLVSVS